MNPGDTHRAYLAQRHANRIALALDLPRWSEARPFAERLAPRVGWLKIGLELFVREGPAIVREAGALAPVFLDLKLHDIPATVEHAVASAVESGARLLTLHASSGRAALERAVRRSEGTQLTPVAVTVLTSLDASDLQALGVDASPTQQVARLAELAWQSGVRAFVSSPQEAALLRQKFPTAILITPGIRAEVGGDDQQRTASARAAIASGSDILVVGRPIRQAVDPLRAAEQVAAEIEAGWKERA